VNALSNAEVGAYLNTHFLSAFQRVGTFRVNGAQKQGGNVASYFCNPDGQVLHVVVGPVDARTLLREARWVVETYKLAGLELRQPGDDLRQFVARAHADRLRQEHGIIVHPRPDGLANGPAEVLDRYRHLSPQARVHVLLARCARTHLRDLYRVVFERILGERISTNPVVMDIRAAE
jgi:hypothetical protein